LSTVEILSDVQNKLLARRELECVFRGGNGLLTRQGAAEAIASKIGVDKGNVQVVSLMGNFGVRDLKGRAYVFSEPNIGKSQMPRYILERHLSKEERKKHQEEKKKAKTDQPSAQPGPKPAKK
jgi:small subunit ribosomal protein S24e